jgi:hypothetical protein
VNGDRHQHAGRGDLRQPDAPRWSSPRPADVPYRLSDIERDEAIAALGDAYAEGRLDHDEFDVRLEAASRAVLASDLDPLFADLPRSRPAQSSVALVPRRQGPARGPSHSWPPVGALLFLLAIAVVTHAWLLILLAFVLAGHRRRKWAPWSHSALQAVGCHPHPGSQHCPQRR